jgi:hypothetical protein
MENCSKRGITIMELTRRQFSVGLAATLPLPFLASCGKTGDGLTIAMDALLTSAEVALAALQATGGISPAEAMIAETFIGNITTFVDFIEMEVALPLTVLQKSAAIAQEALTLGLKSLPPGLPSILAVVFNAVLQNVATVLANVQVTTSLLVGNGINSFAEQKRWNGKVNKKALAAIAKKNAALKAKLHK